MIEPISFENPVHTNGLGRYIVSYPGRDFSWLCTEPVGDRKCIEKEAAKAAPLLIRFFFSLLFLEANVYRVQQNLYQGSRGFF